jgi:hypothetical protein
MTHVSRPFQLVLVIFGLFAIVWLVALRGHNSASPGTSSSSSPSSASTAPAKSHDSASASQARASAPSHGAVHSHTSVTVHGSHGTVHASSSTTHTDHVTKPRAATTKHPTSGSAHTGASLAGAGASAAAGAHGSASAKHAGTSAAGAGTSAAPANSTHAANGAKTGAGGAPAMQVAVERELAQNKTVVILFWSPRGAEDIAVRQQVPIAARALGGNVAVHYALPHQVTEYGKITNTVQVNQTPTILIVNKRGQATALTGLTDAFAIEQAVGEARTS